MKRRLAPRVAVEVRQEADLEALLVIAHDGAEDISSGEASLPEVAVDPSHDVLPKDEALAVVMEVVLGKQVSQQSCQVVANVVLVSVGDRVAFAVHIVVLRDVALREDVGGEGDPVELFANTSNRPRGLTRFVGLP